MMDTAMMNVMIQLIILTGVIVAELMYLILTMIGSDFARNVSAKKSQFVKNPKSVMDTAMTNVMYLHITLTVGIVVLVIIVDLQNWIGTNIAM